MSVSYLPAPERELNNPAEPAPDLWAVKIRATVEQTLTCAGCTEAEARADPYRYLVDEHRGETVDFEVLTVEAEV